MQKRVVVTGLGLISPLSNTAQGTFSKLCSGSIGISEISPDRFPDFAELPIKIAGLLPDSFNLSAAMKSAGIIKNFYNALTLASCASALEDSQLQPLPDSSSLQIGAIFGSDKSSPFDFRKAQEKVLEGGYDKLDRFIIPKLVISQSLGTVALALKLKGYTNTVTAGFVTGQIAVADAVRAIRLQHADVIIAGASEVDFDPSIIMSLYKAGSLARSNEIDACKPFDIARDGFVYSIGAGAMIIESLEHALARNAKIYAEIVSSAAVAETKLNGENTGPERAMRKCIVKANIEPEEVELVNADAPGLKKWDLWEANAIEKVCEHALVTSHKGNLGHMLSASGICQNIITSLCIKNKEVPPIQTLNIPVKENLNYVCRIPEFEANLKPNRRGYEKTINYALCNSFSYDGGCFSSILYKKYEHS